MAILQGFAKHHGRGGRRDAGLHQREIESRVFCVFSGQPYASLFIGGEGAAPPSRVSHPQGVRPALDGKGGGGQEGERGEAPTRWALRPIWTRVCPLPLSLAPWTPCGGRTSPPRGWSPPTLGPRNLLGQVAPLGGPPGPSRWSRYVTDKTRNFSGDQNRTSHI